MTKYERETLKKAAAIIARELLAGRTPAIPGFGRFYLSKFDVYETHPMADEEDFRYAELKPRLSPKFRPFGRLKDALKKKAMQGYWEKKARESKAEEPTF